MHARSLCTRITAAVVSASVFWSLSGAASVALGTSPKVSTAWKSAAAGGKSFSPRTGSRGPVNLRAVAARPRSLVRASASLPFLRTGTSRRATPSGSAPLVAGPPPVQATITSNPAAAKPGFQGLAHSTSASTAFDPPDPWVGVGPDHVAQVVNTSLRVTNRSGTSPITVALEDFFGITGTGISNTDPRIIYDSLHGRWLLTEVEWDCDTSDVSAGHGYIDVAVSAGADPTGDWTTFFFQYNDLLPDYAAPGTSSDKVAFSSNVFNLQPSMDCTAAATPAGTDVLVVDWSKLLNLTAFPPFDEYAGDTTTSTPRIAVQTPATSAALLIVRQLNVSGSWHVDYATITGTVGAGGNVTTAFTHVDLTAANVIQEFLDPQPPKQPSGGNVTTAIDSRPTDAVWQNNKLTFVSTQACTPTGDTAARDCVRVSQLDTSTATPTLAQDFLIAAVGEDRYYGGIGVSGNAGLFVAWAQSSATGGDYPSSYAAYQLRTDAANSISPAERLFAGLANHAGGRWGDYVGVAQDPQDPNAVWQGNEYASADTNWGTLISQLKTGAGSTYVPISPSRVLDSRIGIGLSSPFASGVARTFAVAGQGGVPANAVAVTGNLTVTQQTGSGFVSVTVAPTNTPPTSTLNFPVGDNRANNVTIPLSATGALSAVYKSAAGKTTHLIFDVTGYFLDDNTGATYKPLTPARILDTRASSHIGPYTTPFQANLAREFPVRLHGGVPSTATAVTGNLTVTGQTSLGFLTLSNDSTNNPSTSTLNFPLGDNRANGVSLALTATGTLWAVYKAPTGRTVNVIFDVSGYYAPGAGGLRFFPLNPGRRLDGRPGVNLGLSGAFQANVARTLVVTAHLGVPSGAAAITGNLTVTGQTKPGFASMTLNPTNNPSTSTINFPVGDNRANGVTVPLTVSGNTSLVYKAAPGSTYLLLDVAGYFK